MDLKELWIGDRLKVFSTGCTGTFEGIFQNKAMVKIDGQIAYFRHDELEIMKDQVADHVGFEEVHLSTGEIRETFDPVIDLHLETWPDVQISNWPHPLDFQKSKCRAFIERAIAGKMTKVTIIHGVGEGVLQSAVLGIVDRFTEVQQTISVNQGGAIEIYFHYQ